MATQAETSAKIFHSLDRDMALQSDGGFRRTETFCGNNNLALEALAKFEWLFGDAIESLAAEIFRGAFDWRSSVPEQAHRPMHSYPYAFAVITG
jgi:hypothetical protein